MKQVAILGLILAAGSLATPLCAKDFVFVHKGKADLRFLDRASMNQVDDTTRSAWFVTIFEEAGVENGIKLSQGLFLSALWRPAMGAEGRPKLRSWRDITRHNVGCRCRTDL